MSRRPHARLAPTGGKTQQDLLDQQTFARNLHQALIDKGWSQSDLARKIWGDRTDPVTGYSVAKNRDRISKYIKGSEVPDPKNLARICEALGMSLEELAPNITASIVDREIPEVSMTAITGHLDKVHLHISKLVPLGVASRIISILADLDGGNGNGPSHTPRGG